MTHSSEPCICLSLAAIGHVQRIMQDDSKALGLRLGVRKSGCSGYAYTLSLTQEEHTDDCIYEQEGGVKVFVAEQDIPLLQGMELDYVQEGLNRHFQFNNPNVTDTCGCGESFAVA